MADNKLTTQQKYRENNKESCNERSRLWRANNREYVKDQNKIRYHKDLDASRAYAKQWREKNQEKVRAYWKSEGGKKASRIGNWKRIGVVSSDFNKLYERYINTSHCELCNIELVEGQKQNNKRCLDHNHETGEVRHVLCNRCNNERWKPQSKEEKDSSKKI